MSYQKAGSYDLKVFKQSELKFGQHLGKGGQGDVYKANADGYSEALAIKLSRSRYDKDEIEEFRHMVKLTHHPNMVRLFGIVMVDERIGGYAMEYMEGGSLHSIIHNEPSRSYKLEQVYQWLKEASSALLYLHSQRMVHRDVKPLNMLLDKSLKLKLCDLGLAKNTSAMSRTGNGTYKYMAPEQLQSSEKQTEAVDVYALAISWWEMRTRRIPFETIPILSLISFIGEQNNRPNINSKVWTPQAVEMINRMWNKNARERPSMEEIHRFAENEKATCPSTRIFKPKSDLSTELKRISLDSSECSGSSGRSSVSNNSSYSKLDEWMTSSFSVQQHLQSKISKEDLFRIAKESEEVQKLISSLPKKRKPETVKECEKTIQEKLNCMLKIVQNALKKYPTLRFLVDFVQGTEELKSCVEEKAKEKVASLEK